MIPTVSCNSCGYATFMPSGVDAEDYIVCPECGKKQMGEDCTQCKILKPGDKPFAIEARGVNAKFKKDVSDMNSQFKLLLEKYIDTQVTISETTGMLDTLSRAMYRKCSSSVASAVLAANAIDIEKIGSFMASPYTTIAHVTEATNPWLDTPKIVAVPEFMDIHVGVPLGTAPNGSRFYLVSNFTLMQHVLRGEVIESLGLDIPLDITIGSLHVSGADMDELEDMLAKIERIKENSPHVSGTSGISPLSAAMSPGGAGDGTNYRTAGITAPTIASLILGSLGVPVKSRTALTGPLTALRGMFGYGSPKDIEQVIERRWIADIIENSNCHLIGGDEGNLESLVKMLGDHLVSGGRRHENKRKRSRVLYIGRRESVVADISDDVTTGDEGMAVASRVSLLDQDDYDDAEIIIVNGEQWMDDMGITNEIVTSLASTQTPVCVWTKTPYVDFMRPTNHSGATMSCVVMRFTASLCPLMSGDIDEAASRPLQFICNSLTPVMG